ncbi:MAG: PadR family transcriptional regulator [Nitrososphaerota archaeon]|nr:PadR family transcriptional regulator [Nitrososphaerota archaeon]MDG6953106.1 PadR family transcriptional regulator [Nitrososphaerota archaeon]MDG6956203.1 PadR family transcriptional regulator [Nitrososphaerota archaeon]MDG6958814.1 PadR family transcriptional regulator [Nitrososphaerota archaeon]MDG6960424.1 PadR family transcriptional regulator [Nitrososphaerota archaeon]
MSTVVPRGMKVGTVSLWLLLLLSERPMYGYEIIRELEKRFSGFWKPKTGTIYPALEKLEQNSLVTSRIEFMEEVPDRKHYALTEKGRAELAQSMVYWTRVTEVLENYKESHESLARYKVETNRKELSKILADLGRAFEGEEVELHELLPVDKPVTMKPVEPLKFKFLYAKENHKLEVHMEIEWQPKDSP